MSTFSDSPGPSRVRSYSHLRATAPPPAAPAIHRLGTSRPSGAPRPPYLRSRSAVGAQENTTSRSPKSWTQRKAEKVEVPDNWQLLREMAEDEAPSMSGMQSNTTIRSILSTSTVRPKPIPRPYENGTITGLLSSSPPSMPELGEREEDRGSEEIMEDRPSERQPLLSQPAPIPRSTTSSAARTFWPPSPPTIAVAKCCIAYLLGSMFTFIPQLAHILITRTEEDAHGRVRPRPAYSAHMVATIVVYFHPAKSAGTMLLADRYAFILILFAVIVCVLSMLTVQLFDHFSLNLGDSGDWISELGDWVVNFLYIGGSMGVLAWAKIWVGNPSFNSGCSMAAVTIFSVVIKEGNVPKLLEILLIVMFGVIISNIICFLIFPTSATTRLQNSISRSLTSFSTLLDLLTSTFLLEKHILKSTQTTLRQAITDHAKAFKTLKADLADAKHERVLDPRIRGRKMKLYDAAIGSLARLAQHLSGMRSSTKLQEGLVRASKEGKISLDEKMDVQGGEKLAASARLFKEFREMAGGQMNDLNECCDEALEAVKVLTRMNDPNIDLVATRARLAGSLTTFSQISSAAIKRLYAGPRREQGVYKNERDGSDENLPAIGEIVDGPNETVFSIYFFLFTFEEFAREMLFLLDTVTEIVQTKSPSVTDHIVSVLPFGRDRRQPRRTFLYQQLQNLVPIDPSDLQPPVFPGAKKDNNQSARPLPVYARLRQRWWSFGEWLRQPEIRYSIKIWIGGAYTEWGRQSFLEYRGEWALIAFFSVNNPTLGQTNAMSFYRCAGTFIGALVGVIVYNLLPENAILLPLAGFLFSIPCFYIVTQIPEHAQTGRFALLAYNLTCLYAYNSRERDYSVWKVAIYRSATVIIGAIWAAVVSRYWWPVTARQELRMGVSDLCLDLSYLYSRLVETNSRIEATESTPLVPTSHPDLTPGVQQIVAMELHLQSQLTSLRDLLVLTKNEPRLKGPFPMSFYSEVLLSCERMLDRLHSMRCVTTRSEWSRSVRSEFDAHVSKERKEMTGSVILYLYTLSAGFRLRTPLPPYLPPAELNRQRLVEAIKKLDVVKRRSAKGGTKHLLYFAYALAMQEVIAELQYLGGMMQDTFGVISQRVDDLEGIV